MPYPWSAGNILTAADLNAAVGTWASYTPVLSGSGWSLGSTGASAIGQYCVIGKTTFFEAALTFGTVGATFGSLPPTITLPTTLSTPFRVQNTIGVRFEDTGATGYTGMAIATSLTTIALYTKTVAGTLFVSDANTSSTVPHTWAATDIITAAGWYRST